MRYSLLAALFIADFSGVLQAQSNTLTFDWSTRPSSVGQSLNAPPISIPSTELFTIKISNVNDLLYSYSLDCTATAKPGPDLSPLTKLIGAGGGPEGTGCPDADALSKKIQAYFTSPALCGTKCTSVPLSETRSVVDEFLTTANGLGCKPTPQLQTQLAKLTEFQTKTSHDVIFTAPISPDANYACRVTEAYLGQPTTNGTLSLNINPTNNVLTLSLGVLFSGIQNRSYSSVPVPNASGTGSTNVLGVQGSSFSSSIAALANFRAPFRSLAGEKWGLDATAGPTYRLDSKGSAASVGFFTGVSVRLYKYLFITPGVHVGSFADYPQGFSSAGQAIPTGFPTPTARNRTTAKFGIAVSFQTKDFGALGKSTATTTPADPNAVKAPGTSTGTGTGTGTGTTNSNAVTVNSGPSLGQAQTRPQALGVTAGVSAPELIDFGELGTTPINRQLSVQNHSASAVSLTFDLEGQPTQLTIGDRGGCAALQPQQECSVPLALAPGAQSGSAQIILNVNGAPRDPPIMIKWRAK